MTTEQFLDALGNIDGKMIADADNIRRKTKFTRYIAAAAAAMILFVSPPLIVSGSDETYRFLYGISPEIAQGLKRVRKSCTDNNITMEVISANVNKNKANICISVHDSENRIDESVDLYDSFYINFPYDSVSNCVFGGFDKEKNTAYFLIEIERTDGKPINEDKVTFGVREMIFGKKTFSGYLDEALTDNVSDNPETMKLKNLRGGSYYKNAPDENAYEYLVPRMTADFSPIEGVSVTGIGYADGALHIQTYYEDIGKTDGHGYIFLTDESGNFIPTREMYDEFSVSFWDDEKKGSYEEQIINIPYEKISDCGLYGEFVTSTGYLCGDWEVTFPVK